MALVLDTEDNEGFQDPQGLALSVKGKVKELESMFAELIKKLDTELSFSESKFRAGSSQ